jgi:hypothetical protein
VKKSKFQPVRNWKKISCSPSITEKISVATHLQLEKSQLQPVRNWKISVATRLQLGKT